MRIILIIIRITTLEEIAINNGHYFPPSNETRRLAAGDTLIAFKLRGVNVRFCLIANVPRLSIPSEQNGEVSDHAVLFLFGYCVRVTKTVRMISLFHNLLEYPVKYTYIRRPSSMSTSRVRRTAMGQPVGFRAGVQVLVDQPELAEAHSAKGTGGCPHVFGNLRFNKYKGRLHDVTSGGEFISRR